MAERGIQPVQCRRVGGQADAQPAMRIVGESMIAMLRGDLGQPPGGWPAALQKKALAGRTPITDRPGKHLTPADLESERKTVEKAIDRSVSEAELASYLMYPKVFTDFAKKKREHGRLDVLPTPVFFYGMAPGDEITVEIEKGKILIVRLLTVAEPDEAGQREVFFELNGQPRMVRVVDRALAPKTAANEKADEGNAGHVPAPMPGMVATLAVSEGQSVKAGEILDRNASTLAASRLSSPGTKAINSVAKPTAARLTFMIAPRPMASDSGPYTNNDKASVNVAKDMTRPIIKVDAPYSSRNMGSKGWGAYRLMNTSMEPRHRASVALRQVGVSA